MSKIIFKKDTVEKNINDFIKKMQGKGISNVKLLFPVKCCTSQEMLDLFFRKGFGFDVSNFSEYRLVKNKETCICFSGPMAIYTEEEITSNNILFYDNIVSYRQSKLLPAFRGLRINFNTSNRFEWSHFGVDFYGIPQNELKEVVNIHFHISDNKNTDNILFIVQQIKFILSKCPCLKVLDIGGSYDALSQNEIIDFLYTISVLLNSDQHIYVECGDLWFKGAGRLITNVIDIKNISTSKRIIFLPLSKDGNLKWSAPIVEERDSRVDSEQMIEYLFFGSSCYEKEYICSVKTNKAIYKGDSVVFFNISPYSAEWLVSFNGLETTEISYE